MLTLFVALAERMVPHLHIIGVIALMTCTIGAVGGNFWARDGNAPSFLRPPHSIHQGGLGRLRRYPPAPG